MFKLGAIALAAMALGAWFYELPQIGCGQIRKISEAGAPPSGAYYCHVIVIPR